MHINQRTTTRLPRQRHQPGIMIILALLIASLALIAGCSLPNAEAQTGAAHVPVTLPGHFSFGITNGKGALAYLNTMRAENGTTWDYRYQYLSNGVNTGHGWTSWGASGSFITKFIDENRQNKYRSEFVYYMLFQSNGPTASDERATDMAKLGDPPTMQAYYADWTLLMKTIGATGDQTIVIVEPDLWGYIQQTALKMGNNHPTSVPASVASSGNADIKGYPDNAQGFAWALLHLRDLYAPRAALALHVSCWGTLDDVSHTTNPNFDATGVGRKAGQFANELLSGMPQGVSSFDLLSNDIADHDSGQSSIWWDPQNVLAPNFTLYLAYIKALSATTGKAILLWQVPVGNQYFATEDNSPGHTQDNRAAYLLSHIPEFAKAGIVGAQFGPPNGGTSIYDTQGDGITNSAPIAAFQCDRCNTHTSTYPDDDGGYLRIFVGNYYKKGVFQLSSAAFVAPPVVAATGKQPATPIAPTPTSSALAQAPASPPEFAGVASAGDGPASSVVHPPGLLAWLNDIRVLFGIGVLGCALFVLGFRETRRVQRRTIVYHLSRRHSLTERRSLRSQR